MGTEEQARSISVGFFFHNVLFIIRHLSKVAKAHDFCYLGYRRFRSTISVGNVIKTDWKMRLLIDKNKAIQILKDRIADIDSFNFNPEAWKERSVLDLKEIFPVGSTLFTKEIPAKELTVSINFCTFITANILSFLVCFVALQ